MVGLILLILFYVFIEQKNPKVTSGELIKSYMIYPAEADKKYLNKEIELTGKVKSYYEFENEESLLQLASEQNELTIYCILINKEMNERAKSLTTGTTIKVSGKCLGIKDYKFPNSIYIETERIK
jgi:hypothetical protein